MCTRFVHRGDDLIVGFNFDIDLAMWDHKVIADENRFYIGIRRPDGAYHSYHGVNKNGNFATLLYVQGNENAQPSNAANNEIAIHNFAEEYIKGNISYNDALAMLRKDKIVYAEDTTMQALFSDARGRAVIIEPGIGYREISGSYALITNYSVLDPKSTCPYIIPGDDRYERANEVLKHSNENFSVENALCLLLEVRQEGEWATRVSFVWSAEQNAVYYVLNNNFDNVLVHNF